MRCRSRSLATRQPGSSTRYPAGLACDRTVVAAASDFLGEMTGALDEPTGSEADRAFVPPSFTLTRPTTTSSAEPVVDAHIVTSPLVAAGLVGAVPWDLLTWFGFVLMSLVMVFFGRFSQRVIDKHFRRAQLLSASLYSLGHGGNDAQKTMGIIVMALVSAGVLAAGTKDHPAIRPRSHSGWCSPAKGRWGSERSRAGGASSRRWA